MSEFLFSEFDEVSAKQWKQKIQVDLKGADYNDTLVWESLEGIHVKPFYHKDDFTTSFTPILGQPKQWRIAQQIFIDDAIIANRLALEAIKRGAETIYFSSEKPFDSKVVFREFPFNKVTVHFNFMFLAEEFIENLMLFLVEKKGKIHYHVDPLGNLARSGNWFHNQKRDYEILEKVISKNPSEEIISIDTSLFQNAGANTVQQLGYAIAHVNEYLHSFASPSKQNLRITFKIATGSNYFFEISKIRALRKLYAILAAEYSLEPTCHILATPSKRNKTLYDYNLNMLRTTTECMSAVFGGANTICNLPYDGLYHKSNPFGERISRNQLLILKSESYFDTVSNPSDGSYYIESLTEALSQKSLELFKDIEKNGGFLKQLKSGTLQKKIKESSKKEQLLFDKGEIILVGTNKFKNPQERMKDDLELYPFVKTNKRLTAIEPIIEKRLAEALEQERLRHE